MNRVQPALGTTSSTKYFEVLLVLLYEVLLANHSVGLKGYWYRQKDRMNE